MLPRTKYFQVCCFCVLEGMFTNGEPAIGLSQPELFRFVVETECNKIAPVVNVAHLSLETGEKYVK